MHILVKSHGRSPMQDAWEALRTAAHRKDAEAAEANARRLLGESLPEWGKGQSALMVASAKGSTEIAKQLLRGSETPGGTVLVGAAAIGPMEIAKQLVDAGVDLNVKGGEGRTALSEAVIHDRLDFVRLLIKAGADFNAVDERGRAPIVLAVSLDRVGIARCLLAAAADANATGQGGRSALTLAAFGGLVGIVKPLLEAAAEINMRDEDGATALVDAACEGHAEIVQSLINSGAEVPNPFADEHCCIGEPVPLLVAAYKWQTGLSWSLIRRFESRLLPVVASRIAEYLGIQAQSSEPRDKDRREAVPRVLGRFAGYQS